MLYHGTSLDRAGKIMREGLIRVAPCGVQAVSMTDDINVALYFASLAADADRSTPIVLPIDGEALTKDGYELEPFSDGVWGAGECDWERETVCWRDIPLKYVSARAAIIALDEVRGR